MTAQIDTYKYHFKIGNLIVHCGITNDLSVRENQHQNSGRYITHNGIRKYWKDGHIVQVGNKTTREAAMQWEKENNCNANWG
jgi:predicted GIY-YIG superfamily endonuclease